MPTPEFLSKFYEKFGLQLDDASIKTAVSIFNETYGVQLDDKSIKTVVSNILLSTSNPEDRDERLKKYVQESFREFAIPYARTRQSVSISDHGYSLPINTVDMLDVYIDVVSYVAQSVSDEQLESMKKAQEEAKKSASEAVKIANEASDAANQAIAKNEYGAKQKVNDANALVEKAKLRMERANNPENFYFKSWEPVIPKFGITSAEVRKIYTDCVNNVNSIKFAEFRRQQMHDLSVQHPMFLQIVNEVDFSLGNTDYQSAKPKYQESLRNIYVTRELMNTHLESLVRRNWLWRFFNRAQIKAVRNYVSAADNLLEKAKFPEDLKAPTMTAATTSGVRAGYSDVDDGLKEINRVFAEVDQAVEARNREKLKEEEIKQERQREKENQEKLQKETEDKLKREKEEKVANSKAKEEAAKKAIVGHEAEIKAEVEDLARQKKPIPDAFFDIRFRPSWNKEESKKQSDLCVEIGKKYISGNKNLPAGVRAVFEANYLKIRAVREFVKKDLNKLEPVELKKRIQELETQFAVTEEMVKMDHASAGINYEPVTFDQLKLQHDLAKELNSSELKNAQQPKEPAPTELKKEDISKNI